MRRLIFQWRLRPSLVLFTFFVISQVATGQVTFSTTSVNFGSVQVGSNVIVPIAIGNAGKSNLTISQVVASGTGFSFVGPTLPLTVAPQGTASLSVSFAPQAAATDNGSLTIFASSSWGGHDKVHSISGTVLLSGTGWSPTPGYLNAPSSLNLGSALIGNSQTQPITLSNSGGSSLTISSASTTGAGFTVSGLSFPYTLAVGGNATLIVAFTPATTGTVNGTLSLSSNATDASITVALSGTGLSAAGTLVVSPASMSFGSVNLGASQSLNGSVSASGGSVTISSASSTNSQFALSGLTFPVTMAAGQTVPYTVTFTPTTTGTISANISFFNGTNSALETATGSGATIQHIVALSWNPSSSTSISGYNVYRAAAIGGPYSKINSSLNASLAFNDNTVQSGQTYYYATTAVDSGGAESTYSNQVQAVVPMP